MIRRFRVKVDGRTYDVEVEELAGEGSPAGNNPKPAMHNPNPLIPVPLRNHKPAAPLSGPGQVISPIPGKVLKVMAQPEQSVSKGEILMVIESMKIENPILAPWDGRVAEIKVSPGSQVRTGDLLAIMS